MCKNTDMMLTLKEYDWLHRMIWININMNYEWHENCDGDMSNLIGDNGVYFWRKFNEIVKFKFTFLT